MRVLSIAVAFATTIASSLATAGPAAVPAVAPPPPPDWYEVELVIFRHLQPGAGATESWPVDPGRPAVESARELLAPNALPAAPPSPFMALPIEASRLADQWARLSRSPRYRPLAYYAWLQPPYERGQSPALRIASPAPSAPPSAAPAAEPPFAFGPDGTLVANADAPPALPPLRTPLDGVAVVGLQRYLYLTLDLVFQPGDLPPLVDGTPMPPFRLTETRRMRSKELHYFDHPMFSVIALITPRPAPPELIDPATGLPRPPAPSPAR